MTGEGIATLVKTFVGNVFVAAFAIGAVVFMFKREVVRFLEFAALALVIGSIIYLPDLWVAAIKAVAPFITK